MRIAVVFLLALVAPFALMIADGAEPLYNAVSFSENGKTVFTISGFPQKQNPPCPKQDFKDLSGAHIEVACFSSGAYPARPRNVNDIKARLWDANGKEYRAEWVPVGAPHMSSTDKQPSVTCEGGTLVIGPPMGKAGAGGNGPINQYPSGGAFIPPTNNPIMTAPGHITINSINNTLPPAAVPVPGVIEGDCANPNNNAAHCTAVWK